MVSIDEENLQSTSDQVEELSSDSDLVSDWEDMIGLVDLFGNPVIDIATQR